MMYTKDNHTFVVCAYKESPYLEECVMSLMGQTVPSHVIMSTSTDNAYIRGIAEKYGLELYVNQSTEKGIAADWNFAYHQAQTPLVTLAHQDDRYDAHYVENMLSYVNRAKDPVIYFANYHEIRNGEVVATSTMLKVKRLLLRPLLSPRNWGKIRKKRAALRYGNPIACWSVCYVRARLPETVFVSNFKSNLDWEEWEKLSRLVGDFVYSPDIMTYHRVHEGSETSHTIREGNIRGQEDYAMFLRFWPAWIAKLLMRFYIRGQHYNVPENI